MVKRRVPNVVSGGVAIPLKNKTNYYYMAGRKHSAGGIDIGKNPRTGLEVEDGEVMHVADNEVKVFSSVPFLNGKSPAQKVLGGENPSKVFKQQESFKDKNGINDDGTKKGNTNKAENGKNMAITAAETIGGYLPFIGTALDIKELIKNPSWEQAGWTTLGLVSDIFTGGSARAAIKTARNLKRAKESLSIVNNPFTRKLYKEAAVKDIVSNNEAKKKVVRDASMNIGQNYTQNKLQKEYGGDNKSKKYTTKLTDSEEKEFNDWYSKVAKYKNLNPNPDADGQDYDYRGYWKNEDRNGILDSNSDAHFTDKYKKLTHPTFSNESIYSNKDTPGGEWVKGKGTWLFKHNKYTARQADRTANYLNGTGEGFILGTDTIIPNKKVMGDLNRSKNNRVYSLTSNGKTTLHIVPSTGDKTKARYGTEDDDERNISIANVPIMSRTQTPSAVPLSINDSSNTDNDNKAKVPNAYRKRNRNITDETEFQKKYDKETGANPNWWKRTTNKISEAIKDDNNLVTDAIGLTSNVVGSLISHSMNRNMLNRLKYNSQPVARTAAKLKTKININPQLDKMRESIAAYERDIDSNTASSRVALARKQRGRLANMMSTNELYADKENKETALINKDRLNQQTVAAENIKDYNTWSERKAAFENAVREKKAENDVSLIDTINKGVQDIIGRREKRKKDNNTIVAMADANPHLPLELFYEQGLINNKTYKRAVKMRNTKKNKKD